jgi:hypothetical protein
LPIETSVTIDCPSELGIAIASGFVPASGGPPSGCARRFGDADLRWMTDAELDKALDDAIEQGDARVEFGTGKDSVDERHEVKADWAVIVPAGAKGGFYLKRPPAGRDELKAEVERMVAASGLEHAILRCTHVLGPGGRLLELLAGGAPGIHFYALNRAEPTSTIWSNLGLPAAAA